MKREVLTTIAGQFARVVLGALSGALLARALTADGRGLFALAFWWPNFLSIAAPMGQTQINATFAGIYPEQRPQLLLQSLFVVLLCGGLSAFGYLGSFWYKFLPLGKFDQLADQHIILGAALIPILMLTALTCELARGCGGKNIRTTVHITTAGLVLQLVGNYLVYRLRFGVSAALAVILLTNLSMAIGFTTLLKPYFAKFQFNKPLFLETARQGVLYTISVLGFTLCNSGPIFLMQLLQVSNRELGIAGVGLVLANQMELVPLSVSQVFLPKASNAPGPFLARTAAIVRFTSVVSIITCSIIIFAGGPAIYMLYGKDFLPCLPMVFIMCVGFVFCGSGKILAVYFNVLKKPQLDMAYTWIRFLVMSLGILLLYPIWGLAGIGVAVTVSRLVRTVLLAFSFCRATKASWRDMIPTRSDVRILASQTRQVVNRLAKHESLA